MEGFRYVRSNRTILSMIALIACNNDFHFSNDLGDAATLCAQHSSSWPARTGLVNGGIRHRRIFWVDWLLTFRAKTVVKFMTGNVLAIALGVFFMSRSHSFLLTRCAHG